MDTLSLKEIISSTFALFAVIDILGSLPILISLRNKMGTISAWRATLVSGVLMILFFSAGEMLLHILSLDLHSFATAGSIVLFILGMEMILGWEFFKGDANHKVGSIVPVAFPIIAGSGTLTTVMSMKSLYHSYNILIAICINLIVIYVAIKSLRWIEKILGQSGLLVIRKFFGIILVAIAVKMFKANFYQ